MKNLILMSGLLIGLSAFADVPQARVEFASAYNGYATIAGRLESLPETTVGVTVSNGGLKYSTITDADGRWSVVIRHRGIDYSTQSFDLINVQDRSSLLTGKIVPRKSN